MDERRRFVRLPVKLNTAIQVVGAENPLLSLTKDTSGGGIAFFTRDLVAPGTVVQLQLKFPERPKAIVCKAQVIWSGPLLREHTSKNDAGFEAGVRFLEIAPEDQRFILQYSTVNAPPELS